MGREFEVKYRATPQILCAIHEKYGNFTSLKMKTVYYDTPSGSMKARHWTIRRRMENGTPVCTVKTGAVNGARNEYEVVCTNIQEAIPQLIALGAPAELTKLTADGLIPICGVQFTRLAAPVQFGESILELALDQGEFISGQNSLPFAEVEAELKSGRDEDAILFGKFLASQFGLVPETKSKFKRALELAAESK